MSIREANDNYPTPEPLPLRMCEWIREGIGDNFGFLIEPSAGDGAFLKAAKQVWDASRHQMLAVEIRQECFQPCTDQGAVFYPEDWVTFAARVGPTCQQPALIIGNPPFTFATEHVLAGLQFFPVGTQIAFLLRLSILCSGDRAIRLWPRKQFKGVRGLTPRPSFKEVILKSGKKSKNDMSEYGIFVWEVGYQGPAILHEQPLVWREKWKRVGKSNSGSEKTAA